MGERHRISVVGAVARAGRMVDRSARRRLIVLAVVGVVAAGLDLLGILMLVPLLAYLGGGGSGTDVVSAHVSELLRGLPLQEAAFVLAFAAAILFIVKGVLAGALLWIQTGVLNQAQVRLAGRILHGFSDAPWLVQQEFTSGGMLRTVSVAVLATAQSLGAAVTAVSEIAVFAAVVVAILVVDPAIAGLLLGYLLVMSLLYLKLIREPVSKKGAQAQVEAERMNTALLEVVRGVRELVVRGAARTYTERCLSASARYLDAYRFIIVSNQGMRYLLEALMIVGAAGVIGVSLLLSSNPAQVLVSVGVLLAGGFRLVPALNTLLVSVNAVRVNEPGIALVEEELRLVGLSAGGPKQGGADRGIDASVSGGGFELRDVTFRYPSRPDAAVKNISLKVEPGTFVGIVGASGSGKSTIVDLVLGLLSPDEGVVIGGARPIEDELPAWRRSIGFVPQDVFIADATLAANVALSGDEGDPEAILEALTLAQLDDVVSLLPDGSSTALGENGVRLSGGQRQRIGLARALYRKPSLLLLDEATSALDNETEKRIGQALRSLHGRITILVIAHRLSTVRECDQIVFLDGGRIGGIGSFGELRESNKEFARLVQLGQLEVE